MSREYAATIADFERVTAKHEMTIVRNNGVDRHLRFRKPGTGVYWFDVLTWPGALCINGDCGTFVFMRIEDMFEFFRGDAKREHRINPSYWSEKVVAAPASGVKEFSEDQFGEGVYDEFVNYCESHEDLSEEQVQGLADALQEAIYGASGEHEAYAMVQSFSHTLAQPAKPRQRFGLEFSEPPKFRFGYWERDSRDYTFSFIWCCYAITWAINKFDAETPTMNAGMVPA